MGGDGEIEEDVEDEGWGLGGEGIGLGGRVCVWYRGGEFEGRERVEV